MCGETGETISHIVSEYSKPAQKEYKRKHENVARIVHWKLCEKFNPQTVTENVNHKLIYNVLISLWKGNQILLFSIKWRRQQ